MSGAVTIKEATTGRRTFSKSRSFAEVDDDTTGLFNDFATLPGVHKSSGGGRGVKNASLSPGPRGTSRKSASPVRRAGEDTAPAPLFPVAGGSGGLTRRGELSPLSKQKRLREESDSEGGPMKDDENSEGGDGAAERSRKKKA